MRVEPPWRVLLLGGASGVGKTQVSYRLAHHYGVGLTEVDDFQVVLEGMTTPDQYPVLHYWRTNLDDALRMSEEERLEHTLSYCQVMARALSLVIANHLESRAPVVLEGDFILPSLALQPNYGDVPADGHVRAVFLHERSEQQLARNFVEREGEPQSERARASHRYSEWLRREATRLGIPAISARPWDTVLTRVINAVDRIPET